MPAVAVVRPQRPPSDPGETVVAQPMPWAGLPPELLPLVGVRRAAGSGRRPDGTRAAVVAPQSEVRAARKTSGAAALSSTIMARGGEDSNRGPGQ